MYNVFNQTIQSCFPVVREQLPFIFKQVVLSQNPLGIVANICFLSYGLFKTVVQPIYKTLVTPLPFDELKFHQYIKDGRESPSSFEPIHYLATGKPKHPFQLAFFMLRNNQSLDLWQKLIHNIVVYPPENFTLANLTTILDNISSTEISQQLYDECIELYAALHPEDHNSIAHLMSKSVDLIMSKSVDLTLTIEQDHNKLIDKKHGFTQLHSVIDKKEKTKLDHEHLRHTVRSEIAFLEKSKNLTKTTVFDELLSNLRKYIEDPNGSINELDKFYLFKTSSHNITKKLLEKATQIIDTQPPSTANLGLYFDIYRDYTTNQDPQAAAFWNAKIEPYNKQLLEDTPVDELKLSLFSLNFLEDNKGNEAMPLIDKVIEVIDTKLAVLKEFLENSKHFDEDVDVKNFTITLEHLYEALINQSQHEKALEILKKLASIYSNDVRIEYTCKLIKLLHEQQNDGEVNALIPTLLEMIESPAFENLPTNKKVEHYLELARTLQTVKYEMKDSEGLYRKAHDAIQKDPEADKLSYTKTLMQGALDLKESTNPNIFAARLTHLFSLNSNHHDKVELLQHHCEMVELLEPYKNDKTIQEVITLYIDSIRYEITHEPIIESSKSHLIILRYLPSLSIVGKEIIAHDPHLKNFFRELIDKEIQLLKTGSLSNSEKIEHAKNWLELCYEDEHLDYAVELQSIIRSCESSQMWRSFAIKSFAAVVFLGLGHLFANRRAFI